MKRKIEIKAISSNETIKITAELETTALMQNEAANAKRRLTNQLWDMLRLLGFHAQDIRIKGEK